MSLRIYKENGQSKYSSLSVGIQICCFFVFYIPTVDHGPNLISFLILTVINIRI